MPSIYPLHNWPARRCSCARGDGPMYPCPCRDAGDQGAPQQAAAGPVVTPCRPIPLLARWGMALSSWLRSLKV